MDTRENRIFRHWELEERQVLRVSKKKENKNGKIIIMCIHIFYVLMVAGVTRERVRKIILNICFTSFDTQVSLHLQLHRLWYVYDVNSNDAIVTSRISKTDNNNECEKRRYTRTGDANDCWEGGSGGGNDGAAVGLRAHCKREMRKIRIIKKKKTK